MTSLRTRTSWARWACRVLGIAAVAAVLTPTSVRAADTVQDFTADFNAVPAAQPTLTGTATKIAGSLNGGADGSANFGRLVTQINDQRGQIGLPQFPGHTGGYDLLTFDFDFRMDKPVGGADGLAFIYLNTANYGTSGAAPDSGEEANAANSFGIGFDTWNNGTEGGAGGAPDSSLPDSISLHYNGTALLNTGMAALGLPLDWLENGNTKHATVTVSPGLGSSTVHLLLTEPATGTTVEPFGTLGLDIAMPTYDGRVGFSARTGGENQNADVDNITVVYTPTGGGAALTGTEGFEGVVLPPQTGTPVGGTPFSAANHSNVAPGPSIQPESPLPGGGTAQPGYYRVAAESGSQHNSIAFDRTIDTMTAGGTLRANFDMRIKSNEPSRADGMSMILLSSATHGSTGPLPSAGGVLEDPTFPNSVGLGFDTFDNINEASVFLNGVLVQDHSVPRDTMELVVGQWIDVDVTIHTLTDNGAGGLNGLMDVVLTNLSTGATYQPYNDLALTNLANDYRIAFGARTGGAFDDHGVDNVLLTYTPVPEPSTFVLFGLAGAGLYVLRRRRK